MDRFDAMRIFVRIVEAGSFTKAAHTLHMSRATATQLVQGLEAHLGVQLLNRTTRKLNLTPAGAAYHARIAGMLADLDDIEAGLLDDARAPRGRLRVDVPAPLAALVLIPALPDFFARYPDIRIDMGASDRKVDLVADNVDCVLRGGELRAAGLVARRVGNLRLGVYAAPHYLARSGEPAHPRDLDAAPHRIVAYRQLPDGLPLSCTLHRGRESVTVRGEHALSIDDGNAYLAAGLAGLGALWLPHYMARAHVAAGSLRPLFEDWEPEAMPLHLAYPSRRPSRKVRVFIDWVVELLRSPSPESAESPAVAAAVAA